MDGSWLNRAAKATVASIHLTEEGREDSHAHAGSELHKSTYNTHLKGETRLCELAPAAR